MNGVVLLVIALVLMVVLKQIIDRNWIGLALSVVALALIFFTGHSHR